MKNQNSTPKKGNSKNKQKRITQKKRVYAALYKQPQTMLMVSIRTGILRANICRIIAKLRETDSVAMVKEGICAISHHKAMFLTTDPAKFPKKGGKK